jgi:signal transduction histidine kinase
MQHTSTGSLAARGAVLASAVPGTAPSALAPAATGPAGSGEIRRFGAGIRVIVALMTSLLLVFSAPPISAATLAALLAYDVWAGAVLWLEARARTPRWPLLNYWIDGLWAVALIHLTGASSTMLVLTLVNPVVLASIGHGARRGVELALFAALGLLAQTASGFMADLPLQRAGLVGALAVLALVPLAALLARPMSALRRRLQLVHDMEDRLDPRRGLDATATTLVDALRRDLGCDVAGVMLPGAASAPALLGTPEDGVFPLSPAVKAQLEPLMGGLPGGPLVHERRRFFGLVGGTHALGDEAVRPEHREALDDLAELLEVRCLIVVPLVRYGRRHGSLFVGHRQRAAPSQEAAALADAAPELYRMLEQAALVDSLQEESTSHERVRIGRDLHDSAIQPYLGLKYAVESVACRVSPDNPLRPEVDALLDLVNAEIAALREIVSGLRIGEARGDNALVPAVRRQVRRFGLLFGIDVQIEAPDEIHTSRALAGALFHMVNEAMNNVRKHTPARRVWLQLAQQGDRIELRVRDDAGTQQGRAVPDFAPRSLMERAAALQGRFQLHRPDGLNTEILISVPAHAQPV